MDLEQINWTWYLLVQVEVAIQSTLDSSSSPHQQTQNHSWLKKGNRCKCWFINFVPHKLGKKSETSAHEEKFILGRKAIR